MKKSKLKPKHCKQCGKVLGAGQVVDKGDYSEIVDTCYCGKPNILRRVWHIDPPNPIIPVHKDKPANKHILAVDFVADIYVVNIA